MRSQDEVARRRLLQAAGLMGASVSLGAVIGAPTVASARAVRADEGKALVWGHVFDDRNGNGTLDAGERGLAGVAVSDGVSITLTDARGRYELSVDPERRDLCVVFVSVPSGWAAAPDAQMIPRFYRQLEPRTGRTTRADFALRRDRASDDPAYRFLAVADPHVRFTQGSFPFDKDPLGRWRGQIQQFNELVEHASEYEAPRFLCVSGDVTEWGLVEEFEAFRAGTENSAVPVWPLLGNHEYKLAWWTDPDWTYTGNVRSYREALGPEWYSFSYGSQHFVVLDNMLGVGQPEQLRWLEQDLALHGTSREVVAMFHAPFPEIDDWMARYYPDNDPVAQAYLDVFRSYDVTLMLSGHAHVNRVDSRILPGAKHVNSTSSYYSLDQTPLGFRVVDVGTGQSPAAAFRTFDVRQSLTLVHPGPGQRLPRRSITVQLSAYDTTSVVRSARYRIDDGSWRPLRPTGSWTWSAECDVREVSPGAHRWRAEVRDDAGRSWTRSARFTVDPDDHAAEPTAGTPWPMFHGSPERGGHSADQVVPPLRLAWSHRTGGSVLCGSPVVVGDTACIGVRDEDGEEQCGLVAVDLATGARRWRVPAESLVEAAPAVADDLVLTTSIGGTLRALDIGTGAVRWEHRVADGDPMAYVSAYASLAIVDGLVLHAYRTYRMNDAGQASAIVAREVRTGAERWTFTHSFLFMVNDHKAVAVGGGRVYVNPGLGPPWGVDIATGQRTWTARLTLPDNGNPLEYAQGPVVFAGDVVLTTYRDSVSKGPNAVVAFDSGTGDERWRYVGPTEVLVFSDLDGTAPAVAGETIYAALPSGLVVALDLGTGVELWRRHLGTALLSSPAVSGAVLYVGGNDGHLYALDTGNGEVRWRYQLGSWVASSPAVSGNTVLVGAWDGNLYAFVSK